MRISLLNSQFNKQLAILLILAVFSGLICGCSSSTKVGDQGSAGATLDSSAKEKPDTFVHDFNPGEENVYGSTSANLANGGEITFQGDWVYYVDKTSLMKMKRDGSQKQTIGKGESCRIQVVGDWVFFCNSECTDFYKMKTDGSSLASILKINTDKSTVIWDSIFVVGTNIYFSENMKTSNSESTATIVKTNTDGTDKRVLYTGASNGNSLEIVSINDQSIFFVQYIPTQPYRKGISLWKINLDGSNPKLLCTSIMYDWHIIGDRLFYNNNSGATYSTGSYIDLNNPTPVQLSKDYNGSVIVNILGDRYVTNYKLDLGLLSQDFQKYTKVNSDGFRRCYTNSKDDWIYYSSPSGSRSTKFSRVHSDGTGWEQL